MLGICIVLIGSSIVAALGLSAGAGSSYPTRKIVERDALGNAKIVTREVRP